MKNFIIASILAGLFLVPATGQDKAPKLTAGNIKEVVSAMTLEEKARLVAGTGMRFPGAAVTETTMDKVPGAAGATYAIPRLGIPSIVLADGPAGLRISPVRDSASGKTCYCTAFPVATLLASTWDTGLVEQVGQSIGNELLEYGVDILLAPALNIHRNPLCGRNFEYFSEDPLISGKMAAAIVRGVQGNGVGTSLKHYAANNTETNRMALNTIVSERALREIYLHGFEIAVKESDPWTVMSSYNLINGTPASESHDLLTRVLRDDWGFRGFVMTDWFGGTDPVEQMKAGNDLLMPGRPQQSDTIRKAVEAGVLDQTVLDRNVERILQVIVRTPAFRGYRYSNNPDLEGHAQVARRAGAEGMVLLKNREGTLPLTANSGPLALFGNASYEIITGGTGSGDVNEAYSVSLREGLINAGYSVDPGLEEQYRDYMEEAKASRPPRRPFMPEEAVPEMSVDRSLVELLAGKYGTALITIGRNSGEGRDRSVEEFNLTATEKLLIETVSQVFHASGKKVVVILNTGGVLETATWRDHPDAIMLTWQAGQETGNAIADVLTGRVNPCGKLATAFPFRYEDVSSAATFPGKELPAEEPEEEGGGPFSFMRARPSVITYEDDIYVGYRYADAFQMEPAYEFGFGLSYTEFTYGEMRLDSDKFRDQITVALEITNSGKLAGKEAVQLYLAAPAGTMNKPVKELVAFAKARLLEPGESQTLSFKLSPMDLCSFDPASSSWIAEPGVYRVMAGASSLDIRQQADFTLEKAIHAGKVSKSLVPLQELKLDEVNLRSINYFICARLPRSKATGNRASELGANALAGFKMITPPSAGTK
jgi:beta-glucosidase